MFMNRIIYVWKCQHNVAVNSSNIHLIADAKKT